MITAEQKKSQPDQERSAAVIFIGWILALMVFDLFTLRCFPVPWYDETLFADPAASLLLQGHWASTLWFGRGDFTYWGGNMPAYSALLVPWMWLWGFSAPAVRSLDAVLAAATLICTWFAVRRLNLIPPPKIRLAALIALSLCYPVSYCVRCGRPDVLGMLLFAAGAFFWAAPKKTAACVGLFFCTLLVPFVGLHYAFFMPVLLAVLLWKGGRPALARLTAIVAGGGLGGLLVVAYYQFFAGWDGLAGSMADVHARLPPGLWARLKTLLAGPIFHYYLTRPHFVLLIATAAVLGITWKYLTPASRRLFWPAVVLLLVPGIVLGLSSHFMAPYHWLPVAPALILLASVTANSWPNFGLKTRAIFCLLVFGLAVSGRVVFMMMGLGTGTAGYAAQIGREATRLIQPGQSVFTDPQLYYALKPEAGKIYYPLVLKIMTPQEKSAVTIAFVRADSIDFGIDWYTNAIGGRWVHVSDLTPPCSQIKISPAFAKVLGFFHASDYIGHPLSVYRRADE